MADHYFSSKPASKPRPIEFKAVLRGMELGFISSSGVFSAGKVDFGTKLLAKRMQVPEKAKVLDLGCGIGVLGIVAAHLTSGEVYMTDVNERACKLAQKNSKGLKNVKVLCGNLYEPVKGMKFDAILLNPPQTAGKKVCFEMIEGSRAHLEKGGCLQLVARHNKGGEVLGKKMLEVFGNMEFLAKQGGYRIYFSKNS